MAGTDNSQWAYWTGTTAVSYAATSTTDAWIAWNTSATTASTMGQNIWAAWAGSTITGASNSFIYRESAQSKREREKREAEGQKQYAEEQRKREAAEARAELLLVALLSLSQRKEYTEKKCFTVIGGKTRKRYLVEAGRTHGNIKELDESGRPVASLCCQPEGVPAKEANLTQKLMLERCEDEFLRFANRRAV